MSLDVNNTNPGYLYGRLLAVCEAIGPITTGDADDATNHPRQFMEGSVLRAFKVMSEGDKAMRDRLTPIWMEILDRLPAEPERTLSQDQSIQAQFGYQHQRVALRGSAAGAILTTGSSEMAAADERIRARCAAEGMSEDEITQFMKARRGAVSRSATTRVA